MCLIARQPQHTSLQKEPGIEDAVDHIGRFTFYSASSIEIHLILPIHYRNVAVGQVES
jgi:hypothetical protein